MTTSITYLQNRATILLKEFIYGGHFQSLGAAAITWSAGQILGVKTDIPCLVIVYFLFYPLYVFNRYKEIDIDEITNPERTRHFRLYQHFMPILTVIVTVIGPILILIFSNTLTFIFGLVLLIFGLLYTVSFKEFTRRIPIFKNIYVALFFATLVIFPLLYNGYKPSSQLVIQSLVIFLYVYLVAFGMQVILDIKDITSDKQRQLKTIPVTLGMDRTLYYLRYFQVILFLYPVIFTTIIPVIPTIFILLSLMVLFNIYCLSLINDKNIAGYVLESGIFLFWTPIILLWKVIENLI